MVHVKFFQANQRIFDGRAKQVILPAESGEVTVLAFHAPMLCALESGNVRIGEKRFKIREGIARVGRNAVTILAC